MMSAKSHFYIAGIFGVLLLLGGCAPSWPQADWSKSTDISKTAVARFVAPADCTTPLNFNPIKGNAVYQVTDFSPVPSQERIYRITFQGPVGLMAGEYYLSHLWKVGENDNAPRSTWDNTACALIIDVPREINSDRPYFVPRDPGLESEVLTARLVMTVMPPILLALAAAMLGLAWFGVEREETLGAVFACLVPIAICIFITGNVTIYTPAQHYAEAVAYGNWFDELPRAGNRLLPLSVPQFWYLLKGPPNDLQPHLLPFVAVTIGLSAIWLAPVGVFAMRGVYYLRTPLPLEAVFHRALAEARPPDPRELDAALIAALAGRPVWQINIMRRKAEAFVQRFHI
jgi:hypothetical protein